MEYQKIKETNLRVNEILFITLKIFINNLNKIIPLYCITGLLLNLLGVYFFDFRPLEGNFTPYTLVFIYFFVYLYINMFIIFSVDDEINNKGYHFRYILEKLTDNYLNAISVTILYLLFVFSFLIITYFSRYFFGVVRNTNIDFFRLIFSPLSPFIPLIINGLLLISVIWLIYWSIYYVFYLQSVLIKGYTGIKALKYSEFLVESRWWKVLFKLLFIIIIPYLLVYLLNFLISDLFNELPGEIVITVINDFASFYIVIGITVLFYNCVNVMSRYIKKQEKKNINEKLDYFSKKLKNSLYQKYQLSSLKKAVTNNDFDQKKYREKIKNLLDEYCYYDNENISVSEKIIINQFICSIFHFIRDFKINIIKITFNKQEVFLKANIELKMTDMNKGVSREIFNNYDIKMKKIQDQWIFNLKDLLNLFIINNINPEAYKYIKNKVQQEKNINLKCPEILEVIYKDNIENIL